MSDQKRRDRERKAKLGDDAEAERLAAEEVRLGRAPLVRLRREDHMDILDLNDLRDFGEVLHDVIQAGVHARRENLAEKVRNLETRVRSFEGFARRTLLSLELSKQEASLVCDALNGAWLIDEHAESGVHGADRSSSPAILRAELEDAINLNGLGKKWKVEPKAFLAKMSAWGPSEVIAVMDASRRFWKECAGMNSTTALRAVGFIR